VTVLHPGITVAIPTHPARIASGMLGRAVGSVWAQTLPAAALSVAVDLHRAGAAVTRQRALDAVGTEWTQFLDSDDELLPQHLQRLFGCAVETGADFVFSWFEPVGGGDPLGHFGLPFDPLHPHHTTMTVLVRTEVAQSVGFTPAAPGDPFGNEDWRFICGVAGSGARMVHLAERTWRYHMHGGNCSGMPGRGDDR
jgi:hypothetical protein